MSFLKKDLIHNAIAESVYNDLLTGRSNYFYYIGKVVPWSDESEPVAPGNTQVYEYETRNDIIATKKVQLKDVSYVVPRIDWTSGTVYDEYNGNYSSTNTSDSGASSLKDSLFYVLTSDFNVYKCINNNSGAQSTVKPTGTSVNPINTDDGYIWKYLYTIPLSLRNKFLTTLFMPVQKSVLNPFYSNGEIDRIVIDSNGTGYLGNSEVTLNVNGTFAANGGNSIANITPVFNTQGQFIDVIIRDRGNNYSTANITINDAAGTGTGYYNTLLTANFIPVLYNGQLDRVLIDDPGTNYSSNVQTTLVLTGDGSGAYLVPYINESGQLEDVIIQSRGSGYTYLDIDVVGDGANANCFALLSEGDLDTNQSTIELSAIDGAIYNIKVDEIGDGFSHANVSVVGDGTGFSASVNVSNANTILSITVNNPGYGYTHANVLITGDGANANAYAIISPFGGHGSNPVKELFAERLMFYSTINNEKIHGVVVDNDYRQFGLIKDLKQYANSRAFANITGTSCYLVTLDTLNKETGPELQKDDIIYLSGDESKKFVVVETVSSNTQVLINNLNNYDLVESDELYESNSGSTFVVETIDLYPTINKFSGDLMFIDNRTSVSYSDQQLVTLRTTIRI